jgi:hypothetical protein
MSQTFAVTTENLGRIYQIKRKRGESGPQTLVALEDVNLEVRQGRALWAARPQRRWENDSDKNLDDVAHPHQRACVRGWH